MAKESMKVLLNQLVKKNRRRPFLTLVYLYLGADHIFEEALKLAADDCGWKGKSLGELCQIYLQQLLE